MDALLTIIIPFHNEDSRTIGNCLESIDDQQNVNFDLVKVALCHNQREMIEPDMYCQLNFYENLRGRIEYYQNVSCKGPGLNRQQALSNCTTPWFMFIDADDELYTVDSLSTILNDIQSVEDDIGALMYGCMQYDTRFNQLVPYNSKLVVWGKVFRTEFTVENRIKFHDDLFLYEDVYFVTSFDICHCKWMVNIDKNILLHYYKTESTFSQVYFDYQKFLDVKRYSHQCIQYLLELADQRNSIVDMVHFMSLFYALEFNDYHVFLTIRNSDFSQGTAKLVPKEMYDMMYDFYKQFVWSHEQEFKKEVYRIIADSNVAELAPESTQFIDEMFFNKE